MKIAIKNKQNENVSEIDAPMQCMQPLRFDLINKAFHVIAHNDRVAYGADVRAGLQHSADLSRRRRKYRGSYGHGISRVPRKILSRRGTRFNWVGAEVPGTVGGRKAHAPQADKLWSRSMNKKENKMAICSAMSACFNVDKVKERGHVVPKDYPFVLDKTFETVNKSSEISGALEKLGFGDELKRSAVKKIRSGRGTFRGRKYRKKSGILFVVSGKCELVKAAQNIPGSEVAIIDHLNVKNLAPGNHPGRVVLFSEPAIKKMNEKRLFQ